MAGVFASALLLGSALAGCGGGGGHGAAQPVPQGTASGAPSAPSSAKIHVMRLVGGPRITAQHGRRVSTYIGSGGLSYHGGQVMHNAHVYVTYWGWSADPNGEASYLESFVNGVTGSAWLGIVTQYGDPSGNSTNQSLQFSGSWHDNVNAIPSGPSDAQIQAEASASAAHFGNDPNGIYIVATPQGNWTPGFAYGNGSGGTWCAYHGYNGPVRYVNLPYQTDSQICTSDAQAHPGSPGALDAVSVVAGHEIAETINDPYLNAWYDASGYEIADKCAWINLRVAALWNGNFPVQPLFDQSVSDCVQPDVGPMYPQWNPGPSLTGNPALGRNPDGRLEAVATDVNGGLWHIWQTSAGGGWTSWYSLGGSGATSPCIASNADGRLQAATVNTDGSMTQYWQTSVNGAWTSANIGSAGGGLQSGCSMTANTNGTLEVVAAGRDGNLYHAWQASAGGSWTGLYSLGNPGSAVSAGPAIGRNQNGTLDVVVTAANGSVYHDAQTSPSGGWTGFAALGSVPSGVSGRVALATNTDGRLEAFVGSTSSGVFHVWESSANSASWSGLWSVAPAPSGLRNAVAATVESPGELEVFATTSSGAIWTSWQTSPGGGWSAWESMGANQSNAPFAAVAPNADGRLELLTVQNDGFMYHTWESAAGAGWIW